MRQQVLVASIAVAALAGGGVAAAVSATGGSSRKAGSGHAGAGHARPHAAGSPASPRHSGAPAAGGAHAIASSCPARDHQKPVSTTPGAASALVPGHPQAVLLCRYSGLNNHPPLTLFAHRLVTERASVDSLAHALDSLRPISGAFACPADFGAAVVAFFRYAHAPPDAVTVGLSGCQQVTNGHVQRLAGPARSPLAGELQALTRPPPVMQTTPGSQTTPGGQTTPGSQPTPGGTGAPTGQGDLSCPGRRNLLCA